jgi:hypothetical protein
MTKFPSRQTAHRYFEKGSFSRNLHVDNKFQKNRNQGYRSVHHTISRFYSPCVLRLSSSVYENKSFFCISNCRFRVTWRVRVCVPSALVAIRTSELSVIFHIAIPHVVAGDSGTVGWFGPRLHGSSSFHSEKSKRWKRSSFPWYLSL